MIRVGMYVFYKYNMVSNAVNEVVGDPCRIRLFASRRIAFKFLVSTYYKYDCKYGINMGNFLFLTKTLNFTCEYLKTYTDTLRNYLFIKVD